MRPSLPSSIAWRIRWAAGQKRRWKIPAKWMPPRFDHAVRLADLDRERLLADDVDARRRRRDDDGGVRRVGGADGHGVHRAAAQHLADIAEGVRHAELLGQRLGPRAIGVAGGREGGRGDAGEGSRVGESDLAAADQADADGFWHDASKQQFKVQSSMFKVESPVPEL
jgi:hypothetical protein